MYKLKKFTMTSWEEKIKFIFEQMAARGSIIFDRGNFRVIGEYNAEL